MMRIAGFFATLLMWLGICAAEEPVAAPASQPPTAEQADFFERRVRPLLVENCYECHGGTKQEGGLRLDSRSLMLKGAKSGAVVVPGNPEQSRLVEAISYQHDIQMPPDGKLADDQIEILKAWIKEGIPWPSSAMTTGAALAGVTAVRSDDPTPAHTAAEDVYEQERSRNWAFRSIRLPEIPTPSGSPWGNSPIDQFVLSELRRHGLSPSGPASRAVLLRRVTFDLVGLPPTATEIEEFSLDASSDALATVVDRLLASPEYGQRWGRHWLDVARYADTKGYVFTQDTRYPYSYTYRDYVVRAFNEDLPYDRFIAEQLAADLLPPSEDKRPLAALGFLTLGSRFMNNVHDMIDDRIDVVTRGLLGLTVSCARCHDHKYDPIPSADYYSLYGVFASTVEPDEQPLIAMPEETAAYQAHQQELTRRQQALDDFTATQQRQIADEHCTRVGDYLVQVVTTRAPQPDEDPMISLAPGDIKPQAVERWRDYLDRTREPSHPVFAPWHALAALGRDNFGAAAVETVNAFSAAGSDTAGPAPSVNRLVKEALLRAPLDSMVDVARRYGELLESVYRQWSELQQAAKQEGTGKAALDDAAAEELRQVLFADGSPTNVKRDRLAELLDRQSSNEFGKLNRAVEEWKVTSPSEPPRAMALADAATPFEPRVFLRGNPHRPGPQVPRQFLRILSGPDRRPFEHGSGRLDLAAAITAPENPLTARVIVNRVWAQHFGAGLVTTTSDFGIRSDPPSHPELLDYLAWIFREQGWSLKKLHRQIVLSSTYQQASDDRPECVETDPENRLLWKMNRRRLEFEAIRDSLLAVAGRLDHSLGGKPVNLLSEPFSTRRTIYGFVDRGDLPGVYRSFDFASPESSSPARPRTTVPQQALFVMNSPWAIEQARHTAARPEIAAFEDPRQRVEALYQIILSRLPETDEVAAALEFVSDHPGQPADKAATAPGTSAPLTPWEQLAQVLLMTNEFVFVD